MRGENGWRDMQKQMDTLVGAKRPLAAENV
jgi:hypothetical protein